MIITMKKRLFILMFAAMALLAPVTPLSTARAQDEPVIVDGRLQGYVDAKGQPVNVQLDPSGTATIWLVTGLLGVVALGFMFMSSKRTHLD
jgi:hypothetical protein